MAAESAQAQALARRAAEPEAGNQDWLAAEEVAIRYVPGHKTATLQEVHDHIERSGHSQGSLAARLARSVQRLMGRRG